MSRPALPDADTIAAAEASGSETTRPIPSVWMLGKVQSGKTSIIRAITQSTDNDIGTGFKAATRTARQYDYPPAAPMLRFLDTRGLGEADYDPAEDLAVAEQRSHLLVLTMRAMDVAQQAVLDVATTVRQRHGDWPIVVAQTCLHEGYERGQAHIMPYPFSLTSPETASKLPLPPDLTRCLEHQRRLFASMPGTAPILFVPVDLTQPGDGMVPEDYGLDALSDALIRAAPHAMRAILQALPSAVLDRRRKQTEPLIMGHAMAAAGSDLVPVAGAVAVSAVQAQLLRRIGQIYGVDWDRRTLAEFSAALGTGVATRAALGFGIRQLAKLLPVYGQTIAAASSAAMSFAVTFAVGRAAVYFLAHRQRGLSSAGTAEAYKSALSEALSMAKSRRSEMATAKAER